MKSLKNIFNNISGRLGLQSSTADVSLADFGEIVRPFLKGMVVYPKTHHIDQGWRELQDWVVIGWEAERNNRGEAATALCHALRMIGQDIAKARANNPKGGEPLRLSRKDLQVLHATSYQMRGAAAHLENIYAKMEKGPVYFQRTVHGITQTFMDLSNTIPPWCRPHDDHAAMAVALRQSAEACDRVLGKSGLAPASSRAVRGYIPPKF